MCSSTAASLIGIVELAVKGWLGNIQSYYLLVSTGEEILNFSLSSKLLCRFIHSDLCYTHESV